MKRSSMLFIFLATLIAAVSSAVAAPLAAPAAVRPYEIVSDTKKTCVFAPTAKTEAEKKAVLIAAAKDFVAKNKDSKVNQLCLAFLKAGERAEDINSWTFDGMHEQLDPGSVTWTPGGEPIVHITHGFERPDASRYIKTLMKALAAKQTARQAIKTVHANLKVKTHPLDWLLAP